MQKWNIGLKLVNHFVNICRVTTYQWRGTHTTSLVIYRSKLTPNLNLATYFDSLLTRLTNYKPFNLLYNWFQSLKRALKNSNSIQEFMELVLEMVMSRPLTSFPVGIYLFEDNNDFVDVIDVVLVSLLLTLDMFSTFAQTSWPIGRSVQIRWILSINSLNVSVTLI